ADVKACYYNFCLKESSWKYFGFSWDYKGKKCWFVSKVLIFGWNVAAYVCFVMTEALVIVLSTTYVLLALGNDLGLSFGKKSQVVSSAEPVYLGFIVMLSKRRLEPTQKKRQDFLALLHSFMDEESVHHSTLERFTGKCAHLSLAFQGGLAFTREQYMAIAGGTRGSCVHTNHCLRGELKEYDCLDLDKPNCWVGAKWLSAKHAMIEVRLETDANNFRLGTALLVGDTKSLMGEEAPDWMLLREGISINLREAQALLTAMCEFAEQLRNKWPGGGDVPDARLLNAATDQRHPQGSVAAPLQYATANSITWEDRGNDYCLNQALFTALERSFGPFTADAMASSVNAKCPCFFSCYRCPGSFGQNLLTMQPGLLEKLYIFPPFSMLVAVVEFLLDSNAAFLIVFPQNWDSWWLALLRRAKHAKQIGKKGETNVFMGYNKKEKTITPLPNPSDMWSDFRFCHHCGAPAPDFHSKGTIAVNEAYIAARTAALEGVRPTTPKAVESELSWLASFLASHAARPAVSAWMATPQDVVDYLISKELDGRTQYHSSLCPRALSAWVGARINKDCDPLACQIRAAPGSIRTASSNLKTGLTGLGLTGPWNAGRGTGNPVNSKKVALHIARLEDEAAKASILPLQAAPLDPNFLAKFEVAILRHIGDKRTSQREQLAWRQFWLLCLMVGRSGRQPGDLVQLRTPGLSWLPDRNGVVVTLLTSKATSRSNPDRFVLNGQQYLRALSLYARDCKWAGINLAIGARISSPE
ncbi:hypothetical protein HDU77_011465, partial [Chytriomyces hyalinus]